MPERAPEHTPPDDTTREGLMDDGEVNDAIREATRPALEIYAAHHKTAHPTRMHDPDCDTCRMGLMLQQDLPGRPDSIEELKRRLAEMQEGPRGSRF